VAGSEIHATAIIKPEQASEMLLFRGLTGSGLVVDIENNSDRLFIKNVLIRDGC